MDDFSKSYQILGLKPDASPEEARQAYRDLVNVWHPDRFLHDERLRLIAQEKLKEINGAYELVKAQFFAASIAPESTALPEPEAAAEAPAPDTPPSGRRHVALWATLGGIAIVLIAAGTVLFLKSGRSQRAASSTPTTPVLAADHSAVGMTPYALSFDGNRGQVAIATTGALSGTFTVECWALSRRPKLIGTILSSRGPQDFSFDLKFRQGKRFHADIGDGSRWIAKMANAPINYQPNTWYHVAYVVMPSGYNVYVNGDFWMGNTVNPPANPLLYDANHQLILGADGLDPSDLDGCIAEVRIWKTARTGEQIRANMKALLTGKEPDLQGYWRFAEGTGAETADCSGHGFTGKFVGNVSWTTGTPPIARQ